MMLYNKQGLLDKNGVWTKVHRISLGVTIALYVLALVMPALETKAEVLRGFHLLLLGVFSILSDLSLLLIWLSNPLFFVALFLNCARSSYPLALGLSLISIILGCLMSVKGEIAYDKEMPIIHYHWGYYLWVASFVGLLLSSLIALFASRR